MKQIINRHHNNFFSPLANQSGSWLVIIIVIVVVLAISGTYILKYTNKDLEIASYYWKNVKTLYVAEAGIERTKNQLKNSSLAQVRTIINNGGAVFSNDTFNQTKYTVTVDTLLNSPFVASWYQIVTPAVLQPTQTADVTLKIIGTFFNDTISGLRVPIQVSVSLNNAFSWTPLFGITDISQNATADFTAVDPSKRIILRFHSTYPPSQILTCQTDTADARILLFKNNDTVTSKIRTSGTHKNLQNFLRSVTKWYPDPMGFPDSIGIVTINENDALYLVEMLNPVSGDFQDAVILATFNIEPYLDAHYNMVVIRSTATTGDDITSTVEITARKIKINMVQELTWRELF